MIKFDRKTRAITALAVSAIFALIYFLPIQFGHKIAVPLLVLAAFSWGLMPWQMCMAFCFSFLGDFFGASRQELGPDLAFMLQMGFFALAHVCMAVFFFLRSRVVTKHLSYRVAILLLTAVVLCAALWIVVPGAPEGIIRHGVAAYALIISLMMWSALSNKDLLLGIGAVLFVFSDFILAWNKFVTPVPAERYLIMVPYYAAQITLWWRCMKLYGKHSEAC